MEINDLSQVKKIVTTTDAQGTNKFLTVGWKIISTASGKDEAGYPLTSVTLGWFGEGEPVQPDY